jgi:hypothetical protein
MYQMNMLFLFLLLFGGFEDQYLIPRSTGVAPSRRGALENAQELRRVGIPFKKGFTIYTEPALEVRK